MKLRHLWLADILISCYIFYTTNSSLFITAQTLSLHIFNLSLHILCFLLKWLVGGAPLQQ